MALDVSAPLGTASQLTDEALPAARWYALWTRSHCERLVHDQLAAKGFQPFLPTLAGWSTRAGRQHEIRIPMFASYLFLHGAFDKSAYIEVRKSRGLVAILGERWDRLATVPDHQIISIQRLQRAGLPVVSHPYLREGRRVRVVRGPLTGVEGILLELKPLKGRLVLSVDLLQRSVATEVDCSAVAAA